MTPEVEAPKNNICRICNQEMIEDGTATFSNWNGDIVHHECRNQEEEEKAKKENPEVSVIAQITGIYNISDVGSVRVIVQLEQNGYHWEKMYDFQSSKELVFDEVMDLVLKDVRRDLQKDSPARLLIPRIGEKVKLII